MGAVFGEEVAVDGNLGEAQRVFERAGQKPLGRRRRRGVGLDQANTRRLWRRQLLPIRLVAGENGQEGQALEIGGDHVGRQEGPHQRDHRSGFGLRRPVLDGVIGHKLRGARARLEDRGGGLGNLRDLEQDGLDLRQLDAMAAQLDLRIEAAEIFDLAVLIDPPEIARAIDSARQIVRQPQKVRDESAPRSAHDD